MSDGVAAAVGEHDGAHGQTRRRHRGILGRHGSGPTRAARLPPLALAYHGIAEVPLSRDPHGLFVSPRDLRRHIAVLRGWGYRLMSFGELARSARDGDVAASAALTFDDGFADNLHSLLPVLDELAAPATVFAVSGWLGRAHPYAPWTRILTADELRELHRAGVEVGGHTASHPDLTTLSPSAAQFELERGRRELEAVLGSSITVAAYPYGRARRETIAACAAAGFTAACRTSGNGSWSTPLDLPRQDMDNGCTLISLRLKRANRYEPLMAFRGGRAARRIVRTWRRLTC